jgi:acetyltransferase-like isoleucine patch superfamily enzyme
VQVPGDTSSNAPGHWANGTVPANVRLGVNTVITGDLAFKRFHAKATDALVIGAHGTMDGVHFDLGAEGRMRVGDYCYFTNAVLLCELEIVIGNYVLIGWNTTVTDTDFHPIAPALRIADAVACSPLGKERTRPPIARKAVVIEDDAWIGPNSTILKGVRIGAVQ